MSWQIASSTGLAVVLVAGFAWFERSRPPAKVVALVAALAALATVGRIAFAPIPNVKPTTDIALFAGYALGPVPGFAVGAIAALVSNFFFGQGPWTPWQMVGWGMAGVMGGGLAALVGRELGRAPLAIACAFAGAAFGALMDLYQWTQGGAHTVAGYLAWSATSLPYNLAHVIGNVGFCLLLGPAFVRSLRRFRRRFEVRWLPAAGGLLVALAIAAAAAPGQAQAASPTARAAAYIARAQGADGGFGVAPGASSNQLLTGWAALGLAASGVNPVDVARGRSSVIDYMRAHASVLSDTGDLERTILTLRAAGVSARSFAGRDLVAELLRRRSRDGSWSANLAWTAFGVLALRASGAGGLGPSAAWLARGQNADGGFGFRPGAQSDVDDTGAALEALGASGRGGSAAARRAVGYLRAAQRADGGFGQMRGSPSNSQSTGWAVQGLVAVGRGPGGMRRGGRDPLEYLRSLQAADGSIRYSRASAQTPVWTTAQALDALALRAFPLAPAPRHSRSTRAALASRSAPSAAASAGGRAGAGRKGAARSAARAQRAGAKRRSSTPAAGSSAAPRPVAARPAAAAAARGGATGGGFAWGAAFVAAGLAAVAALALWRLVGRRRVKLR